MDEGIKQKQPSVLMILDGWGYRGDLNGNAVAAAETPVLDKLIEEYPHTLVGTSGLSVGLPDGQMGDSEVGHMNIGAGRIVRQSLTRIDKEIEDGSFFENEVLIGAMGAARGPNRGLHLIGLISPGGVHSHTNHLLALVRLAKQQSVRRVYIHAFLDGRDTPPRSAEAFISELEEELRVIGTGKVVSVSGRYYAMDRDNRWERVQLVYDALAFGTGLKATSSAAAIQEAYERGEDDEFVKPTIICTDGEEATVVKDGDAVVFFNFRPDRARELTVAFTEPAGVSLLRKRFYSDLFFVTMTEFDASFSRVHVAYQTEAPQNTLGVYISSLGLRQLRIAETEKYAHVTFFFNGGIEEPEPGEDRVLIPSPEVATYDLKPEMSAYEVTERVITELNRNIYDVIIINFANMDMVGHTGVFEATVKAVEAVDECLGKVVEATLAANGRILITADHGNAEEEIDEHGEPMTAHTSNPAKLILVREGAGIYRLSQGGVLADIAPTFLQLMGIPVPSEMTGRCLLFP